MAADEEKIEGAVTEANPEPAPWHGRAAKPKKLSCDFETYSSVDIGKSGMYKYMESPDFAILLLAYAFDDEDVKIVDVASGEQIPEEVLEAVEDKEIIKCAWNAAFERNAFSHILHKQLDPEGWQCSMVLAASLSLPLALKNSAKVLKTGEQKDKAGEALIKKFSVPQKDRKTGKLYRVYPWDALADWYKFKDYCLQDVRTERDIRHRLDGFPMTDREWQMYWTDQRINDRGVLLDMELVEKCIACDLMLSDEMTKRAYELTGLENPNSVSQLKRWLEERGISVDTLGKKNVEQMITDLDKNSVDQTALDMLKLRLQMAKSSVKKYQAAERCVCSDERARGLFQFYGANRTGRWSGRLLQLQNLSKNHIDTLSQARDLMKQGEFEKVAEIYGDVPDILSQLVRTMLVPKPGYEFIIADFSAIECRVLAWEAGENWVLDSFRAGKDIYCSTASSMFHVPVEKHGVNGELRQKGKIATLACIAEGSLVLTNHGEKPIEDVTTDDLVWDGCEWVEHEGVIYKGEKQTISFKGLIATPDHIIVTDNGPISFKYVAGNNAAEAGIHKVYDIVNAGQRHQYKVGNFLVHNCGYQGGTGALVSMGALEMGLKEDELPDIIESWRNANPKIVQYWWDVEKAAIETVKTHQEHAVQKIKFQFYANTLWMVLPSGRRLAYMKPKLMPNKYGRMSLTFEGLGTSAANYWVRQETYGGKLVENATQAIARDILAESMLRIQNAGIDIVAHIHDEVILEVPKGKYTVDELCDLMAEDPSWCKDLPLASAGYRGDYYYKS